MPIVTITPIWYMVVAMVGNVLVVMYSIQWSEGRQKRDGIFL